MRTLLLTLSLVPLFFQAYSQQVEVVSISTNDRIFTGTIDDTYPITLYLKAVKQSEYNGHIQALTGWYSYDKIGTPIPLAGIIGQGLHLVSSNDQQVLDQMLNFQYETDEGLASLGNRIFELAEKVTLIKNVTERFELSNKGDQILGFWYGNEKSLKVELHADDYRVSKTTHYLKHANGDYFDLSYFGIPGRAYCEVIASANNGQNILLDYGFQANLNYMGRCGAAENRGKIGLVFNEKYELKKSSFVIFEDCYRDIYTFKENKVSESITDYEIEHFENSEQPIYFKCTVNLEKATITRK